MPKFVLLGVLALGFLGLSAPSSHTQSPEPNAYGWNNTPVTVTISGTPPIHYRVNGGPWISGDTVVLSSEGIHTVEYYDATESPDTPNRAVIRIDLTPPTILVRVPEEDKKYILHEKVFVDWFAYDRISGLELTEASARPGEPLDTGSPGYQTFWVFARDRAGNSARLEVDYQVIFKLSTVFPSGFWLDRLLPPEEQVKVGLFPVLARYKVGEPILFGFLLRDANDVVFAQARPNVLVTEVRFTEEGERHTIWDWVPIPFDQEKGFYFLAYPTEKRKPGIYDLWLGFGDGQSLRIRVEIQGGAS
ncbi:MAG: hypothetical protein ACPLRP_00950 [Candidatus Bipolaricaulaceae bacterium]